MKKIVATVLSVLMLGSLSAGVLAGCASKDSGALSFWAYEPSSSEDIAGLRRLVSDFTEEAGIVVNLNLVPKDEYNTSFNTSLLGSKKPDVAYLDQPLIADYASDGTLAELSSFYSENGYTSDGFFDGAYTTVTYGEGVYGVPLTMTTTVVFYNKDYVSEDALPASWAEWLALGEELPAQTALFDGIGNGGYMSWYFQAFLSNAGGSLMNEGNTEITFNSEQGVTAAQMLREMYNLSPAEYRNSTNAFGNGHTLFKLGSSSDIETIYDAFPNLDFGVTAFPPQETGDTSYSNIGGENLVILESSKKKDDAEKLIAYLLRGENVKQIAQFTGNFAALKEYAVVEEGDVCAEMKQVVLDQLDTAQARPSVAGWLYVNDNYIATALENILAEDASDISAADILAQLDTAASQAKSYLKI